MDDEDISNNAASSGSGIVGLIIVGLIIWWGYNTFFKNDTWQGMYETNSQVAIGIGGKFGSKEECLRWLNSQKLYPGDRFSFECGKNCKAPETIYGAYRCKETVD